MQPSFLSQSTRPFLILFCMIMAIQLLPGCRSSKQLQEATSPLFLIPAGYQGSLTVVYGEECGQKPAMENGKPVFRFPENGILILQEKDNHINRAGSAYYFIDSAGNRQEITQVIDRSPGYTIDSKGNKKEESRGNTTIQGRRPDQAVFVIKAVVFQPTEVLKIVNGVTLNKGAGGFSYTEYGVYGSQAIDTTIRLNHPTENQRLQQTVLACRDGLSPGAKNTK